MKTVFHRGRKQLQAFADLVLLTILGRVASVIGIE